MKNLLPQKCLLPLLCLTFLFSSCKKELDELEVDPVIAWEAHNQFLYNQRYISNLYATDDRLQVLGMHLFSTITQPEEQEQVRHYVHRFKNVSHYKHPMSSKIFGGTEGDLLFFKPVSAPVTWHADVLLEATKLDPHFKGFALVMSYSSESFAISENNVALVPYHYRDEEQGTFGLRYFLIKLEVEDATHYEKLVVNDVRILTPNEVGGVVRHMRSHQNNFYVSTDWGFYKITETGEINFQLPDEVPYTTFPHKGDIYAITRHARQHTHALIKSNPAFGNWSMDTPLGSSAEYFYYYAISDDILLASRYGQIFEVEIGSGNFIMRELDNTGLEGHFITSIAMVGDKVYIGTHSGLFSKAIEHFLTYKEEAK